MGLSHTDLKSAGQEGVEEVVSWKKGVKVQKLPHVLSHFVPAPAPVDREWVEHYLQYAEHKVPEMRLSDER